MKSTKPGATLPKATRTTLRRTDFFRIGAMIQKSSDISAGTVCYHPGRSDDSIAKEATEALGFDVSAATIAKTRKSLFGSIPGEAGSARQKIESLRDQVASLSKGIAELSARMARELKDQDERLQEVERIVTTPPQQHRPQPAAILPARSLDYPADRRNGSSR